MPTRWSDGRLVFEQRGTQDGLLAIAMSGPTLDCTVMRGNSFSLDAKQARQLAVKLVGAADAMDASTKEPSK